MAEEVEIAKNSLDVLNEVFQLGSTFSHVSRIINLSGSLASAIPFVGAILGLIGGLLPGDNHKEIINRFNQLDHKIDQLKNDMIYSENVIKWKITEHRYGDAVTLIELGIEYCLEIGKASEEGRKARYRKRVEELCAHENCAIALKTILNGMVGDGLAERSSMLDQFYDKTEGHRPKISALATRLLQLAYRGMIVISTHETIIHGKEGAIDATQFFYSQLNEASNKVKFVLGRCQDDFRVNMLNELNRFLDKGGSNGDLVTEISNFMSEKYDWLENYCLVYNDMHGFENHCINGYKYVHSFHRNGKCGVIFSREKNQRPKFPISYFDELFLRTIDHSVGRSNHAQNTHTFLVSWFKEVHFDWIGSAVISGYPDLRVRGTFSTKFFHIEKRALTMILLLE